MENKIPDSEQTVEEKTGGKENRVKAFNVVLAIVMAVCLWAFVVGEVNPETKKTISGVPLTIIGESDLEANGLVILTEISDTVDVVVTGRRSEVYDMTASKITAGLDVSGLHEGENQVSIKVTAPSNVEIEEVKNGDLIVAVDSLVKKEKPVSVSYKGNPGEGGEMSIVNISTESVTVSGPKSVVARVVSVAGELEVNPSTDTYVETLSLIPVDASGKKVKGVKLSTDRVSVEAVKNITKVIPVKIEMRGTAPEGCDIEIEDTSLKITGEAEYLNGIAGLSGDAIDISEITETTTVNTRVMVPQGVNALDSVGKILEKNSSGKVSIEVKIIVSTSEHQED